MTRLRAALAGLFAGLVVAGFGLASAGYAAPTVAPGGSCPPGIAKHKPWLCPTPTPSATVSPSPSPSTTPPPSPSATTTTPPPPSPSPTVTPTPTPSPTSSPPLTGCMTLPSACGFPDATNTGTTGPLTLVTGNVTLSTAGMIYEGKDVRGCISVRARNITIRNVRVTCPSWYGIGIQSGTGTDPWVDPLANLLVEDSEINLAGGLEIKGIAFDGYTARRVHFYGGADCAHMGRNVTVVDSFCEIPAGGPQDGPHYDGFQSDGGANIRLIHNTIRVPYSQTSTILMSTNTSPIRDVTIADNLVAGGGYAIYCGTDAGGPVQGTLVFTGNRISRIYFPRGGYLGPVVDCPAAGWVWD